MIYHVQQGADNDNLQSIKPGGDAKWPEACHLLVRLKASSRMFNPSWNCGVRQPT
jgi:hypothetical protein